MAAEDVGARAGLAARKSRVSRWWVETLRRVRVDRRRLQRARAVARVADETAMSAAAVRAQDRAEGLVVVARRSTTHLRP